jgi:hypothetical protein
VSGRLTEALVELLTLKARVNVQLYPYTSSFNVIMWWVGDFYHDIHVAGATIRPEEHDA